MHQNSNSIDFTSSLPVIYSGEVPRFVVFQAGNLSIGLSFNASVQLSKQNLESVARAGLNWK